MVQNLDDTANIFQMENREQQNRDRAQKDERRMFTGQGVKNDYDVNPQLLESMNLSVI